MKNQLSKLFKVSFITLATIIILLVLTGIYYLNLPPISKYMFKTHLNNCPFLSIKGYFEYHKYKFDTLFESSNRNKFIIAYLPNISPKYAESFIMDSLQNISVFSGISIDGKIVEPKINDLSLVFPDANFDTLIILYANGKWPHCTGNNDSYKKIKTDDGVLLINTIGGDSLKVYRIGSKLMIKTIRVSNELYD